MNFKHRYNVTLVGMLSEGNTDLNCRDGAMLGRGGTLYYITGMRLNPAAIAWDRLGDAS